MTIDEAIEHCKEKARFCSIKKCADEHLQLAEWLEELKKLRKLFTLDEYEVIIVEHFLICDKKKLESYESSLENDIMIEDLKHILNRIKDWQL